MIETTITYWPSRPTALAPTFAPTANDSRKTPIGPTSSTQWTMVIIVACTASKKA